MASENSVPAAGPSRSGTEHTPRTTSPARIGEDSGISAGSAHVHDTDRRATPPTHSTPPDQFANSGTPPRQREVIQINSGRQARGRPDSDLPLPPLPDPRQPSGRDYPIPTRSTNQSPRSQRSDPFEDFSARNPQHRSTGSPHSRDRDALPPTSPAANDGYPRNAQRDRDPQTQHTQAREGNGLENIVSSSPIHAGAALLGAAVGAQLGYVLSNDAGPDSASASAGDDINPPPMAPIRLRDPTYFNGYTPAPYHEEGTRQRGANYGIGRGDSGELYTIVRVPKEPKQPDPVARADDNNANPGLQRNRTHGTQASTRGRSVLDHVVPVHRTSESSMIEKESIVRASGSVSARLASTLDEAKRERDKYKSKARYTGYALNIAIGLQVLLGSLTTGLSAVATRGKSAAVATTILGALATLVASYLARARGSNEPELSITRTKDLDQFIRECTNFDMDKGTDTTTKYQPEIDHFRDRFENLLGNANGERKLSPSGGAFQRDQGHHGV